MGLGFAGFGIGSIKGIALTPLKYSNPETSGFPVQLGLNENPYGPSPRARIAMRETIEKSNRYHWDNTQELVFALAENECH